MKKLLISAVVLFISNGPFAAGETHHCVAVDSGEACKYEIEMTCPSGFTDGCNTGKTKTHQCVVKKGTVPCAKVVAIVCPSGFKDGCSSGNSNFHECVTIKGTIACEKKVALVCPPAFQDSCLVAPSVNTPTKPTIPSENGYK